MTRDALASDEELAARVLAHPVDDVERLAARPVDEAVGILEAFRRMARVPFVVALNRSEGITPADETAVRSALQLGPDVAVVPCDATDRESVKSVLLALLYSVVDELDAAEPARA